MDRHAKNLTIIIFVVLSVMGLGLDWSMSGRAVTGNFVHPDRPDYYPETVLTLQLTNLTINQTYAIKIGANQFSYDWQWVNFTATATDMSFEVIHFDKQSYLTNQSQDIQVLLIELYSNNTRIDLITYDLVRPTQLINPYFLGMLIVVLIGTLVMLTILLSIVKQFV